MKIFAEIVDGFQPLTLFAKSSNLDIWLDCEYASVDSTSSVILIPIFPHSDWIRRDTPNHSVLVRMRENMDQNNSEYGHFSRSVYSCLQPEYADIPRGQKLHVQS